MLSNGISRPYFRRSSALPLAGSLEPAHPEQDQGPASAQTAPSAKKRVAGISPQKAPISMAAICIGETMPTRLCQQDDQQRIDRLNQVAGISNPRPRGAT